MKLPKYLSDEEFAMWLMQEATPDEYTLSGKAENFKDLFDDFLLQDSKYCLADTPTEMKMIAYAPIVCRIRKLRGSNGQVKRTENALTLSASCKDDDSVLLHEMTHVFENILDSFPINYHEFVFIHLYRKLSMKEELRKHLDGMIDSYSDPYWQQELNLQGGKHDILFFLKCLDIDIIQGYPLGTTMGYGYVDKIKTYIEENSTLNT